MKSIKVIAKEAKARSIYGVTRAALGLANVTGVMNRLTIDDSEKLTDNPMVDRIEFNNGKTKVFVRTFKETCNEISRTMV